ncbi:MAG: UDP-galactopyranose mutase [Chthoniobacterales bacterium]
MKILIVGAGFSGATVAQRLTEQLPSCEVTIFESRNHVAGNCHTERDAASNVMVHKYGPHIFNTNEQAVWDYVSRFTEFQSYTNRVKAVTPKGVFSLPVNLLTINQFFNVALNPTEAREFIESKGDSSITEPANFEEQALKFLGRDLYENFFYGYTKKQWGCEPTELSASILKRLPVRFDYNDNYYSKIYQGIPKDGYTALIERMLDHPRIKVELNHPYQREDSSQFTHTIYTGAIDGFYNHSLGRLGYRTVTFERIDATGDFQGNAVINYTDANVPYTRIHEHKHFTPWETHEKTVAFREFSKETEPSDVPYYPKRLEQDKTLLDRYTKLAGQEKNVSFLGRLATYRYMDMEHVIDEALQFSERMIEALTQGGVIPVFPDAKR